MSVEMPTDLNSPGQRTSTMRATFSSTVFTSAAWPAVLLPPGHGILQPQLERAQL